MEHRWDDEAASTFDGLLGECVYGSRVLGADPALVLHGGGNTSVKVLMPDVHGEDTEVLYVKGSGWDLATIEASGFAPLRLGPVQRLADLSSLSDTRMVNELRINLLDAAAPNPSVEAILHASLPFTAVQHSHADAVLAITNTVDGEQRVRSLWGDRVVVIPYVMPGFDLAKACAERFAAESHDGTVAMVLLNHGIFTFGETTRQAYDRMIELVTEAETYVGSHAGIDLRQTATDAGPAESLSHEDVLEMARLRTRVSEAAGGSMIVRRTDNERAASFAALPDVGDIAHRGPATPDHIIRTKQFPLIGRNVEAYVDHYRSYFERNAARSEGVRSLDPAPRVIIDPDLGVLTAARRTVECDVAADIYLHTIDVITAAEGLGGYVALPEADLFEVEYWELEQAKLAKGGPRPPLVGEVAVVTGAASGIGAACAEALLADGAAVVGLDIADPIVDRFTDPSWLGLRADVTQLDSLERAVRTTVERFGGIDMVVAAAGIFGTSAPVAELDPVVWHKTMEVNLDGVMHLLSATHPILALSPLGGRVVIVGSKNVSAPGKGAAAYSASKAAVTQLGRIAALEWADDAITVNSIHPDGVFDTGLWTDQLIAERAANYGLDPESYKKRNLLHREITSHDVGGLIATMCGPAFGKVTGAQLPVDGGNERVI